MSGGIERLVYMANQIATALRMEDKAAQSTFDHIMHFWSPAMRRTLEDHVRRGGTGLNEIAQQAARQLIALDAAGVALTEGHSE